MARRRKRRGGRKSKSIPVLMTIAGISPAVISWQQSAGDFAVLPTKLKYNYLGIRTDGSWDSSQALKVGGFVVGAMIAHKVANKVGVNKAIRKASFGYLSL